MFVIMLHVFVIPRLISQGWGLGGGGECYLVGEIPLKKMLQINKSVIHM